MIVILILLAIVAICLFVACNIVLKKSRWLFVIPLGLMVIALILGGIRILDSTEIGVVKTFGKIDHPITGGLNFVNPISDTVTKLDLKVQAHEATFASYTKDAQPVTGAIEYQYTIDPAYAMDIVQEYGNLDMLQSKLGNVIEEKTKIVFSRYGAMTLLENRANLSAEVTAEVKTLEDRFNVKFNQVIIRDIDFSDAFEASVEAKMEAEQTALKAEQEKKTAVIKAQQAQEVAEIQAQAAIAEAKGEAEAMAIKKDALEKMPATYIEQLYLEKWNGVLPTYVVGDGSSLMLTPGIGE